MSEKYPSSAEIRRTFLDFFQRRGHTIVPSSPLVLPADPSLLFVNAGMNQFKDVFLGARRSETRRVADTQKCIRVSGKHNDLEEVGRDTYHHTFFEMLGNWSFGDYYKKEAIEWAWELLTRVWGLPRERLWATVYREDDEAERIWKDVTDIDRSHVLRFGEKDNFWEMADTGPCGPCSEIHIDLTENGCSPEEINSGSPDVIELWNLVFIQYDRHSDGSLHELPEKHVDTGMGFERLVAVLQGKHSNYDTDLFQPLIAELEAISGRHYGGEDAVAMRVIADHLRALAFAVADGVLPSNEGRGYVLRRLLRRAARFGRRLGLQEPFMGRLFPRLQEIMGDYFGELREHRDDILRALKAEEESFAVTLDRGIALFEDVVRLLKQRGETVFPGDEAFKLYDTYGFPVDLTELMASEQGLVVDREGFEELMESQRRRAREASRGGEIGTVGSETIGRIVAGSRRSRFVGYEKLDTETDVTAVAVGDAGPDAELTEGQEGALMLTETPFYAEAGGQVGDQGVIRGGGAEFEVWDTQKFAEGVILHFGKMVRGKLSVGDHVAAILDKERRGKITRHHTATHLLNYALRKCIGATIRQAGSFVGPERLRFDFSYHEALTPVQLEEVERLVTECILENTPVRTYEMALKDVPGSGIIAVFDEKYGERVRVLDIGGFSRELCGGTHVKRTGDIGLFHILSESSVASGVRRIEAVCGWPAYHVLRREHELLESVARRLSIAIEEIPIRVEVLLEKTRRLEKKVRRLELESAGSHVDELLHKSQKVGDATVIAANLGECSMETLRSVMDQLRGRMSSGIAVAGSSFEGRAHFMAVVTSDWVKRGVHAGRIVSQVARITGGGGGGRPEKAQAGGKDGGRVGDAIERVPEIVAEMLGLPKSSLRSV